MKRLNVLFEQLPNTTTTYGAIYEGPIFVVIPSAPDLSYGDSDSTYFYNRIAFEIERHGKRDASVPTLTFNRWGRAAGHSRHDFAVALSAQAFAGFWDFQIAFAERIVNAEVVPVPREIPEDLKKDLDRYFHRDAD